VLLSGEPVADIDAYLASEVGGLGLNAATRLGRQATIEEITASGLRGRGGGGFPTGRKWAGVAAGGGTHRYAVANGAEGEPGTFKDRAIIRHNPYLVVEGLMIAAYAVGASETFVAVKEAFAEEAELITRAVVEMQEAGVCRDCQVTIVRGPDEYLFGEEKALLEVIEGKPPMPRLLPPHEHGLFATAPQTGWTATDPEPGHRGVHESNPTLVNNVETLANATAILARGAQWFRARGTEQSPGTVVATVVGDVGRPGVYEVEMGTPLRAVLERAEPTGPVKAVLSGVANPVVTSKHLDTPLTYEAFAAIGSGLGAAGFIVYDDSACMVEVARVLSRFLYVESCGQCPPCKRGSGEITELLDRIDAGDGSEHDVAAIHGWLRRVTDGNRCYLAVEEQVLVGSILESFPEEFADHLASGACPRPRGLQVPKLVDIADGCVVVDERQGRKLPDWTYGPADLATGP
jgi:NADH-quinone oxidoreductase subunit F